MQLTATNLSELVRALRSNTGPGEKRKHPRVGLRVKAQIMLSKEQISVWIRDISAGGTNFSSPQPIPEGTHFELLLSDTDKIACIAQHSRQNPGNVFAVGARFTQDVSRRMPVR
jgi:hypothetical protein